MSISQKTRDRVGEVAGTLEWLITAFALAFVFRAFVMEAFRIPTGSMADTLLGAHYRLRCTQCGYKYCYGQSGIRPPGGKMQGRFIGREYSHCPSCGYLQPVDATAPSSGDRILVLKCLYQFEQPRQWDVLVFKNPLDPPENYIKRLIGRPGETVEIIDGDIYIDGQISRKPPKVQREMWMPIYDNDYQPARPEEPAFNGHTWQRPLKNADGSKWMIEEDSPTIFRLDVPADERHELVYDTTRGNDFRATYAYDEITDYRYMPYCSDLMIRFWVSCDQPTGMAGASLSKYGITYAGKVDFAGRMAIVRLAEGKEQELSLKKVAAPEAGEPTLFRFANVDHKLILEFGEYKTSYDLGRGPDDAGPRKAGIEPQAVISGAGTLAISHIAMFRDIHYLTSSPTIADPGRATEGNPLTLEHDQFFVLGDNSPRSEDGRWWASPGKGNNGVTYPKGIVPREYLVGKALFVYWPAGFKPFAGFPLALVPNVGELRFIYGGSDVNDM